MLGFTQSNTSEWFENDLKINSKSSSPTKNHPTTSQSSEVESLASKISFDALESHDPTSIPSTHLSPSMQINAKPDPKISNLSPVQIIPTNSYPPISGSPDQISPKRVPKSDLSIIPEFSVDKISPKPCNSPTSQRSLPHQSSVNVYEIYREPSILDKTSHVLSNLLNPNEAEGRCQYNRIPISSGRKPPDRMRTFLQTVNTKYVIFILILSIFFFIPSSPTSEAMELTLPKPPSIFPSHSLHQPLEKQFSIFSIRPTVMPTTITSAISSTRAQTSSSTTTTNPPSSTTSTTLPSPTTTTTTTTTSPPSPTTTATTTNPPSSTTTLAACSLHSLCSGLSGNCCPNNDGVYLDCCSETTCSITSPRSGCSNYWSKSLKDFTDDVYTPEKCYALCGQEDACGGFFIRLSDSGCFLYREGCDLGPDPNYDYYEMKEMKNCIGAIETTKALAQSSEEAISNAKAVHELKSALLMMDNRPLCWNACNHTYLDYAVSLNFRYAQKHGLDFKFVTPLDVKVLSPLNNSRRISWLKPVILYDMLSEYDVVMYMDSDMAIVNDTYTLEDFLLQEEYCHKSKAQDIVIAGDMPWGCDMNSGLLIVKNTDWAKCSMKGWWNINIPKFDQGGTWDQDGLRAFKQSHERQFAEHVSILKDYAMKPGKSKVDMFHHFWRWVRHKAIADFRRKLNVSTEELNNIVSFIEQNNRTVFKQSKVYEMLQNVKGNPTCKL